MNDGLVMFLKQHVVDFDLLHFEPMSYPKTTIAHKKTGIQNALSSCT